MNSVPWLENAALRILAHDPAAQKIACTMQVVYNLIEEAAWDGGCHAISAIMFVLLREQGVDATLRLGEVGVGMGAFDHSWIEIDNAVYDVAIARPLSREFAHPPVVNGCHVHDGQPTQLVYGAISGLPPDPSATRLQRMSLGQYMDMFPGHPEGLWGVALEVGMALGLHAPASALRERYSQTQWARTVVRLQSPEDRQRERNRRKRERRERR